MLTLTGAGKFTVGIALSSIVSARKQSTFQSVLYTIRFILGFCYIYYENISKLAKRPSLASAGERRADIMGEVVQKKRCHEWTSSEPRQV